MILNSLNESGTYAWIWGITILDPTWKVGGRRTELIMSTASETLVSVDTVGENVLEGC